MLLKLHTESERKFSSKWIAQLVGHTEIRCHRRYLELIGKAKVNDFDFYKWTPRDDDILRSHVSKHGSAKWKDVASILQKWTGKECMRRYCEFVKPSRVKWTDFEDQLIPRLYEKMGPKWALMA